MLYNEEPHWGWGGGVMKCLQKACLLISSSIFLVIGTHWIREIVSMLLRGKAEYTNEPLNSLDFYDSSAIEKLPSPRVLQVQDVPEKSNLITLRFFIRSGNVISLVKQYTLPEWTIDLILIRLRKHTTISSAYKIV